MAVKRRRKDGEKTVKGASGRRQWKDSKRQNLLRDGSGVYGLDQLGLVIRILHDGHAGHDVSNLGWHREEQRHGGSRRKAVTDTSERQRKFRVQQWKGQRKVKERSR